MTAFLGVDGGGTKTTYCVLDGSGAVLANVSAPSTYHPTAVDVVEQLLAAGVARACTQAGVAPGALAFAFFGLPGYGEASTRQAAVDRAPRAALGHDRYACDNDMVGAWAGSLALADGINLISGTGSMTYGERGGRRVRTGGWGELFGDEGSAHWIAVRGLALFAATSDGRASVGPLHGLVRQALGIESDLDAIDVVLGGWAGQRGKVAALAPVVVQAAEAGDRAAARILEQAADELFALVEAARRRLGFAAEDTVPVSYSGGVFRAAQVLAALRRRLASAPARYELREPLFPPEIGAALYAAHLAGQPLGADALARLRAM